jgi:hypothetical protein
MDGLSRIVQIAYSSLPVIAFVKVVCRYGWKFCLYLGSSAIGSSSAYPQLTEASLEILWQRPSMRGTLIKLAALALACIFLYRTASPTDETGLDDAWDEAEQSEEETNLQPQMMRSEEDRVFLEVQEEEEGYYYDEEYPIDF